jgi:hypothetical protein
MLGGYDMNQFGIASQGKLIEKKNVAEAFTSGHGSPFVAQVSMANAAKLYKAMLDGLEYRGQPSSNATLLANRNMVCRITCRPIRRSSFAILAACRNSSAIRALARLHRKRST